MRELLRTNDLVLLSRLTALLAEAEVPAFVFDDHSSSVLGGSVDMMGRRLMVADEDYARARRAVAGVVELPADG